MRRALLVALLAASLAGLAVLEVSAITHPNQLQKTKIINQIKSSGAVSINADNSRQSPLYIQEASVKEISGEDFTKLVGEPPKHFKHSTFPDVTLLNSSGKTVRAFAISVQSGVADPNSGYIVVKKGLSISPNSTYKLLSGEWPKAERVSVQKGDKFVTSLQKPGLDSAKAWVPGAASDLKVMVGMVEFEDGSRWMLSSDQK